ncbi:mediator of RNA polymerase II transcription subunit 14 [Aspergillus clavatus NRRL 1]|uniref:Mediator of RNA polymerase II transcription subunit 14 n=1 Tax=Aspergillus clavatus (strain ATCC 1007 / CBS 513.65 / DSM 816 / NCTC 3887 / NRRL 1 / QM 1276 / 107) TaxID=344612 RepID=MED14_ASPCL|nr:RNA polymerase II holoenzyme/mediator complex component Rgr1, putative [Aspergillus clavatus NRRL 1]A1C5W6.1 RecName: Full=Mediator of RNA polymerase II transcription subunit 14; AltName: Full=Mediator complex subunit 14 [Aspergillus clavatus NRRL 1]EAW13787.1 RNA polymerase II holoenzyme/mediator complex component Rgr1, putative [Aspergillus clavatus NRRL 1]
MPGVVMDNATVGGPRRASESPDNVSSTPFPQERVNQSGDSGDRRNRSIFHNGAVKGAQGPGQHIETHTGKDGINESEGLPELAHITQGFFPFSTLVNRSVQQCWNDLSELVTELAAIQVSPHGQMPSTPANGKAPGDQSPENLQKKTRILDFAHAKRAEFIKLLVLSQWSRQAGDVSRLIDLQNFIRNRHQAFMDALQRIGDMKRDLVQAQVANPDLKTALEVLSKGRVVSITDLGYEAPKQLTAKGALKRLHKINRIISARLALHDTIPRPFRTYRVHDGRATFVVQGEFELDLSVGEESKSSQFFFVDIRFLFSPSSHVPKGRLSNELDVQVNDRLRDNGLKGCFDFLHGLVLTNKITILFKQAVELARGLWSDVLRVELLHRTLVVQYWALKLGAKSWIEIGIKSGRKPHDVKDSGVPYLALRWIRDGQEVDSTSVEFDADDLSMERLLRSIIALHISHLLSATYSILNQRSLFATGLLSLQALLNTNEPGKCQLLAQLTVSRHLRVSIEPMSGAIVLSADPSPLDRSESDSSLEKSSVDDIVSRVSRLRCIAALEEAESTVKILGFETVSPRGLKADVRKILPPNILRFALFWHPFWDRSWIVAATSSTDGDSWWVIHLRRPSALATSALNLDKDIHREATVCSGHVISNTFLAVQHLARDSSFADLSHCLSGMVAIHANASYLADLRSVAFQPPLRALKFESGLEVPNLLVRYQVSTLPRALQLVFPAGVGKKDFIRNTVRVAFHGIDQRRKVVIFVAYGNLLVPMKELSTLVSKLDGSLVFKQEGDSFAIRLLAPAGQPVIVQLFESLQRLECMLSIFEFLRRKKLVIRSLSLSQVAFAYGPRRSLAAVMDIGMSKLSNSEQLDPVDILARTDPLLLLRLGIRFDHSNPHRRIQGSLAAILNHTSNKAALDSVAEILSFTLPAMRTLDQITSNLSRGEPARLQVVVRNAFTFLLHYINYALRFELTASQHAGRLTWVLRESGDPQVGPGQDQIRAKLRDTLYNSNGNGWKGLGNGVVADVEGVCSVISNLDTSFAGARDNQETSGDVKPTERSLNQTDVKNHRDHDFDAQAAMDYDTSAVATNSAGARSSQQCDAPPEAADVITID